METVRIAVVGAGVIGLSTAVCISQMVPGCSITVISDKFSPDTTSNVAAGILIPHTYPDTPVPTQKQWFTETFQHLSTIAKSAEAADAGIHLVSGWQVFRSVPTEKVPFWADVVLGFRKMTEAELKQFPQYEFGQAFTTLKCETAAYLPWLEKSIQPGRTTSPLKTLPVSVHPTHIISVSKLFRGESGNSCPPSFSSLRHTRGFYWLFVALWRCFQSPWFSCCRLKESGGLLLTRRIEDLWELQPSFDIVVNCSGLGSRQLVGDSMISPVRGQVLQAQAPWVKNFIRDGSGLTYIYPGTSYVTLGGTRQKGDWNLSPDAELSREIFSRCCALEPSLHRARNLREKVGLRPSRPGVRLQKEILVRGGQRLLVVHNYGHGSGGISVHWGSALEATRLVMDWIRTLRTPAPVSKL